MAENEELTAVADLVAALRDLGWDADTAGEGRYFGMTHPNGVQLSGWITEQ